MSPAQRRLAALAAGAIALVFATASQAACNALALCTCTAVATGVTFGPYAATDSGPNDATGSVTVTCVLTVAKAGSFTLALSTGSSNSFTTRTMKNGANVLTYNLFTSDQHSQVLGDGSGGSQTATGAISPLLTSITTLNVYGRVPAGQNVLNGAYSDTIMVTITY